jgi:hypothetical protein
VTVKIAAALRTRELLRRPARVPRGNASMRGALAAAEDIYGAACRGARTSWLRDVVLRSPALISTATCYATITLTAAMMATLPPRLGNSTGGRDNSRRRDDYQAHSTEAADGRG